MGDIYKYSFHSAIAYCDKQVQYPMRRMRAYYNSIHYKYKEIVKAGTGHRTVAASKGGYTPLHDLMKRNSIIYSLV